VHPEAYCVVEKILDDLKRPVKEVLGNGSVLSRVEAARYTDERFGLPTVQDILRELEKPGRDPRPEFKAAAFKEGIEDLKDLVPGMLLEGVVTNVTNFGAFVDIGVHQDGLVHISMLSNRFVRDPHEVVKAGEVVKVKVLEVDIGRKRVALTMRLDDPLPRERAAGEQAPSQRGQSRGGAQHKPHAQVRAPEPQGNGMMADALRKALKG
jgi:uncharacterized protein